MFPSFQVCSRPVKNQHGKNHHLIFSGVASTFLSFVASWQPVKKAPFVFSRANSTTLPNLKWQDLHVGGIFSAARKIPACGREVDPNQVPAQSPTLPRDQKDHRVWTIYPSGTPHGTRLSRGDNRKNLGLELLCLDVPDSPGHPWLSSKAWDSEFPTPQQWETLTKGVHGKMSFNF